MKKHAITLLICGGIAVVFAVGYVKGYSLVYHYEPVKPEGHQVVRLQFEVTKPEQKQ